MNSDKNFAWPVTDTYSDNVVALKRCIEENESLFRNRGITLFGAGIRGNELLKLLEMDGYIVHAFIDNNVDKQGGCIDQYPIVSLEKTLEQNALPVIIVTPENCDAIRGQLNSVGLKENVDFFCIENETYEKYVAEFMRPYSKKNLALGDCALSAVSLTDTNRDSLAALLQKSLGKEELKILAMHGMGMGGYFHMLRMQISLGMRPKHLLLEVNMETFMPRHHLLPRSQHVELLRKVSTLLKCKDKEFQDFIDLSAKRFGTFQTDFFSGAAKNQKNRVSDNSAKLFFKMNYMYSLDRNVEGFVYYMKLLALLKHENIKPIIFIPPVNYQFAYKLFDDKFRVAYEANLDTIRRETEEMGFSLLELQYVLTPDEFCAVDTPTETSNYAGRQKLCTLLSRTIQ